MKLRIDYKTFAHKYYALSISLLTIFLTYWYVAQTAPNWIFSELPPAKRFSISASCISNTQCIDADTSTEQLEIHNGLFLFIEF
jgi:hypothetical protein